MSKKKVIAGLIALASVASSIIPVSYASNEKGEVHASQTQNNPYIQQYNKENGITSRSLNSSLSEDDEAVYKTLTIYYQEDVKVGKILAQVAKDTDVQIKATSMKKEDKIDVMHKIKETYSSVKESSDQKVLVDFIERYAKDSKDIVSIQFLDAVRPQPSKTLIPQPEEDIKKGVSTSKTQNPAQNPAATLNSSFNAATAADWAYNNYNRYSTDFPAFTKWGSDCTNFVSQALYAAGLSMTGNWYIYKKNSTYLVPESAEQLNYSWNLSDPSPWTSVKEFYSFWRGKYIAGTSRENYEEKHKEFFDRSIYRGDLVIFSKGLSGWITIATHVMIITEYDSTNKDFKLAGHSNERQAYPLLDAIKSYSNIDFYSFR